MQNILQASKTKYNNEEKILRKIENVLNKIKTCCKKKRFHIRLNEIKHVYLFFQACRRL